MTTLRRVAVGTRTSPLSVAQTEEVLSQLRVHSPECDFAVVPIVTSGDRYKDAPLLSLGRGTFVKEIETALLNGEIDLAVHSAKDLLSPLPEGLTLAAIGRRKDPRDVQVNRWGLPLIDLPPDARLGTSSPRRTALLKELRADIRVLPIRGNVGTRLDKARGDDYDGVVLAAAGIVRLGREAEITEHLPPDTFVPEVGQGALAVEARAGDTKIIEMLAKIDHGPSRTAFQAERAFLAVLGGGCTVPVAAYAQLDGSQLHISAMAAVPDGSRVFRTQVTAPADDAEYAGRRTAQALLAAGAGEILERG
jgi:hydroxymethylbilane synthase